MTREEPSALKRAVDAGADNVLYRPVKRAELLFAARTLVRLRTLLSELPTSQGSQPVPVPDGTGMRTSRVSQFEFFKAFLAVEIKRARRYGFPLSLMLACLDQTDEIEARHGSVVLRQLLAGLARAVRRSIRDIDIPVTLRDDTILVLMPHTDGEGAKAMAERVRLRIRRSVYREGEVVIRPTISIGATTHLRDKDRSFSQVMRRASQAMKEATQNGGDRVVVQ
jgi:diguanylate cyclase (GGDEF)-like protein